MGPISPLVIGRIFKVHAAPEGSQWMWTLAFGPARRSDAEARLHRHSGGCYGGIRQELAARIGHKSVCCHNDCLERICAIPNRWKIDDCVQISHLYRARVLLCCRISLGRFVVERSILGWQRSLEAAKLFRSTANISAILAFALRFGLALSSRLAVYRINTSPSSETRMTAYGKKCECRLSHMNYGRAAHVAKHATRADSGKTQLLWPSSIRPGFGATTAFRGRK